MKTVGAIFGLTSLVLLECSFPCLSFDVSSLKGAETDGQPQRNGRASEIEQLLREGDRLYRTGNFLEAIQKYEQALELDRQIGDRSIESILLGRLGDAYIGLEQYTQAEEFYNTQLALAREIGNRASEGDVLFSLGWTYNLQAKYQEAIEFFQQALAISRELSDPFKEARALYGLGWAYDSLRQADKAVEFYEEGLAIARSSQDPLGEASILNGLGWVHTTLEKYREAIDFFQKQLSIAREIKNDLQKANALNGLGFTYFRLQEYEIAIHFSEQALAIHRELGIRREEAYALGDIGNNYAALGEYQKAIDYLIECITIQEEIGDRWGRSITLSDIAKVLEKQNRYELSVVFYKESVNAWQEIRRDIQGLPRDYRESFTETFADTYRRLADLLLSQGRILEAQQVLELLKVQEIRNFTRSGNTDSPTAEIATNPRETEVIDTHNYLITLGQAIKACRETQCAEFSQLLDRREETTREFNRTVADLEKEIRERRDNDSGFFDPQQLAGKAEAIVSAQPGTVLIYPFVLEDKLWILWAAAGGITKSIEVPDVGQLELAATVLRFRQLLQTPDPRNLLELQATGKQLYDWLIPPALQRELAANDIQNLVFSLDRVTRYIPISALFDGDRYLVESYNISTVLSAGLTDTTGRLPPGTENTSVLAFGVSEAIAGFDPLPNVPEELDAIVRRDAGDPLGIFPGLDVLNDEFDYVALRDNLELWQPSVLHIATHGEFVPGNATASYLVLGNGEKLPIEDIQALGNLDPVHLVVLSACETALGGSGEDGTEIAGISSYFLNQGVDAVMASLWLVDDASTRLLMEQFYANLAKSTAEQPITKAQALRQAQLALIQNGTVILAEQRGLGVGLRDGNEPAQVEEGDRLAHPYYWAPFILIGNGL